MKDIKNIKDIISAIIEDKKFILIVLLGTFLVYANVIRGEFVTADDIPGIVQNPLTQDLIGSLKTFNVYTVKNALLFQIAGMNSHAFHFVSILTHLLNIVFVYGFAVLLFKKDAARLASLIFALHPVNAETVMWISGNPYAMNALFYISVFIPFVLYEKTKNTKYLIVSIAIFLIMILNDRGAWPLVTPIIIVVIDQFLFSDKINVKRGTLLVLPFILLAATSAYIIIGKNYHNRVDDLTRQYYFNPEEAPPLLNRLPFTTYMGVRNLIFPYELNIYPGEKTITLGYYKWISFVTVAVAVLILYLYKKNRIYTGLIFAIIASVGPTLSPIQVAWLMTERYMYLGSIFFAMLIALVLVSLQRQRKYKSLVNITIVLLVFLYVVRLLFRTEDWRTNKNLWLSTRIFSPQSYRVYNNLGDVYMKEKDYDKAIESFEESFKLFPGYADAMHNLGLVYMVKGDLDNAQKYMEMAIQTKPTLAPAWEKLGIIYYQREQYVQAIEYFNKTLELDHNSALANQGIQAANQKMNETTN